MAYFIATLILILCYSVAYCFLPKQFWSVYSKDTTNFKVKGIVLAIMVVIIFLIRGNPFAFTLGYCLMDPISYYFTVYRN